MIWSAGDLGIEIDFGPNQPGAILQRKEENGYQDFLIERKKKRHLGSTGNDQIQDVDAKESTKPATSRLDWRKYRQKSVS